VEVERRPRVPVAPRNAFFPMALRGLLVDPANQHVIKWDSDAREVVILDKPLFIQTLLPRTFKTHRALRVDQLPTAGEGTRMYDSFVRQLNYYGADTVFQFARCLPIDATYFLRTTLTDDPAGFRKALRNTNRYVVMDRSIESPDDFRFLNRYIPSHALRPAADPIREVKARTVAREAALDAAAPPASLDAAVLATESKRSAPKQIYDPSVERKKPQHGSSSSRKRSRTPTPPVGGILPNAEGRPPKRSAAAAMERTVLNRA